MLLVDTNVLVDVLQNDPQWADWSIAQLRAQSKLHALAINPVIYAEMSLSFSTLEALDDVVLTMALELREVPRPALFLAARAYALYRRRGGSKGQVLPDFFIVSRPTAQRSMSLPLDAAPAVAHRSPQRVSALESQFE